MIKYGDIFNDATLNIFTDASMLNNPNETVGAPGYVAVIGFFIVNEDIQILRESSNSESELYAIYMAIQFAIKNRNEVKAINIFSDSQFAIFGLREWIFNWCSNIKNDKIYNSAKKEVAHQSIFMSIVSTIIAYDLKVSFYHNRGHFSLNQINKFIYLFTKHNMLNDYIDEATAKTIIYYNGKIDKDTRNLLAENSNYLPEKLQMLQYNARNDLDLDHYRELLNI